MFPHSPMISFKELWALCDRRRSVRYFSDESIPLEEIKELMEVAQLAPSVENTQPWHFHIIMNNDLRKEFMETSCYGNFVAGASVFIVVTCDKASKPSNQEIIWNPKELEYSCVSAIDHFILAATAKGIESCWVSLHHGPAHDILKLADNQVIIGGIMLGKLKKDEEDQGSHHERRDVKESYTMYE